MKISIAFITYNRSFELRRAIDSIISQMVEGDEIVIADNGSRDEHRTAMIEYATQLSAQGVKISLQFLDRNYGVAGGRNRVWKMARNPYVLFLDDDCVVEDAHLLKKVRLYMTANPGIGALSIHIKERESDAKHNSDNVIDRQGYQIVDRYHGGAHLVNRQFCPWDNLYPDDLFWGAEESYASLRIWGNGREIHLLPDALVSHYPETTSEGRVISLARRQENAVANLYIVRRLLEPRVIYPILDFVFVLRLMHDKHRLGISIRNVMSYIWHRYDDKDRQALPLSALWRVYRLFGWKAVL